VVSGACTGRAGGSQSPRANRELLTQDQIREKGFVTVFDVVQALRSNWLLPKGTDSFSNPGEVQVYLNNVRMGGVAVLRTIPTETVLWVRHYDGITASARWGLDHGHGVIFVSTSS